MCDNILIEGNFELKQAPRKAQILYGESQFARIGAEG